MTYFKSLVSVFILLAGLLFQICDVSGQWVNIKNHIVEAANDAVMGAGLAGVVGAADKKVFGDIEVDAIYHIDNDPNGSKAKSTAFSNVSMMAVSVAFRGFASIRGTADAGHTRQFAGNQNGAVKTDKGVLDSSKHQDTNKWTVQTALVNDSGRPISLSKSQFTDYKKWYATASPELQEKWGDSEGFSYKHSDNTFYTAMKEHPVHSGKGWGHTLLLWNHKKARDFLLSDIGELLKQKQGNPTDK